MPDEEPDDATRFLFGFVTDSIAALLTSDPDKQSVAQEAALRLLDGQDASDEADLLLATQMTGFGIAALRTLGAAHRPGLQPAETQRLLSCATGLSRVQDRLRRTRQLRGRVPMTPRPAARQPTAPDPAVRPVQSPAPKPVAAGKAPPMPPPAPALTPDTPPAEPTAPELTPTDLTSHELTPAEWRRREAWADAASEAAQVCLMTAPSLPPEQRKHALARAAKLGNAARDVRAGLPPPFDLPQIG